MNGAKLIQTDIDASNGVIHVIDSVLLPGSAAATVTARRITSTNPHSIIVNAISHGAPMYNAGNKSQCAQIYMQAAESLLAMPNHGMSPAVSSNMINALNNARRMSSADSQAWTMRYALDMALNDMGR